MVARAMLDFRPREAAMQKTTRNASKPAIRKPPLPMPDVLLEAKRIPDVVRVPARTVIAIDGAGAPEDGPFGAAIAAVYAVGYGIKFAQKSRGHDFRIGPLETRWWAVPPPQDERPPRETWRWQVRLAIPDSIEARDVAAAASQAATRKDGSAEALRVRPLALDGCVMGRILHVGPYTEEPRSLEAARAALLNAGITPAGPHLEIYLNDPRRTAPQRLKTVLLIEAQP
jgi:hypothetical protein